MNPTRGRFGLPELAAQPPNRGRAFVAAVQLRRAGRRRAVTIRGIVMGAGVALGLLGPATVALAGPSPQRTVRMRLAAAGDPNGPSSEPALSADGRRVAFTSAATNLTAQEDGNGPVRDVFVYDQGSGAVQLASGGLGGTPADATVRSARAGRRRQPSRVHVARDEPRARRRQPRARRVRAAAGRQASSAPSVATGGEEANGRVGRAGPVRRRASARLHLQRGQPRPARATRTRPTTCSCATCRPARWRSSAPTRTARPARAGQRAPAISADGRYVSFSSDAPNLADGDRNGRQDVFVRDLATGRTQLVSVARGGGCGQNRALRRRPAAGLRRQPATGASSSSSPMRRTSRGATATGAPTSSSATAPTSRRAASASARPTRRAAAPPTCRRSRRTGATSRSARAPNDLVAEDAIGPDVFVRELRRGTTVLVDVTARGRLRGREHAVPPPGRPVVERRRRDGGVRIVGLELRRRGPQPARRRLPAAPDARRERDRRPPRRARQGPSADRLSLERPRAVAAAVPPRRRPADALPARRSAAAEARPRHPRAARLRRRARAPTTRAGRSSSA